MKTEAKKICVVPRPYLSIAPVFILCLSHLLSLVISGTQTQESKNYREEIEECFASIDLIYRFFFLSL